jgi:hypothetical protein
MQATYVADQVLIQLGENVQMYIGTRAKPNMSQSKGKCHNIPCNSHKYKYTYMHLYKKKSIHTHMLYTWLFERMCAAYARLA